MLLSLVIERKITVLFHICCTAKLLIQAEQVLHLHLHQLVRDALDLFALGLCAWVVYAEDTLGYVT